MMNHDLLTKAVSQFDKNKQHVAPVHKNTNLKIPPSEHLFQPKTADPLNLTCSHSWSAECPRTHVLMSQLQPHLLSMWDKVNQ